MYSSRSVKHRSFSERYKDYVSPAAAEEDPIAAQPPKMRPVKEGARGVFGWDDIDVLI